MAKLILCYLLAIDLFFITLGMARPVPELVQTAAFQLHVPSIAKPPSSSVTPSGGSESGFAGAPLNEQHMKHRPSVAGGEVILCGLVMAAFAAIVCYIRVTRKRDSDDKS